MKSAKGIKGIIIALICVALILGYYYYLSNVKEETRQEDNVTATAVQEVLLKDLENNYPPTPKEVVKFYSAITQCFYSETYTDEQLYAMAAQIQKLYDDELVANKTQQQYMDDLKIEIANMKDNECVISSYATSASTDVEYYSKGGFDWAKLRCSYTIRQKTALASTNEVFLLRKDDAGHWKIYGWKLAEEDESSN